MYRHSVLELTCVQVFRLVAGPDSQSLAVTHLSGKQQDGGDDLEVVVAGEGDEEVEEQPLAVFEHLRPMVIQTCTDCQWRPKQGPSFTLHGQK